MARGKHRARGDSLIVNDNAVEDLDQDTSLADAPEIEELTGLDVEPAFELKLQTYLDTHNIEKPPVHVHIYKFDNPNSGNEKMCCGTYENEIPSMDEIGKKFGAGRYLVLIWTPKKGNQDKLVKGLRFRLHPVYDDLMRLEREKAMRVSPGISPGVPSSAIAPSPPLNPMDSMMPMLTMFKEFMTLLTPLLANRNTSPENPFPMLMQNYQMTEQILKQNLKDSATFYRDLKTKKLLGGDGAGSMDVGDADYEGEEQEKKEPTLLEALIPAITQWLPMLFRNDAIGRATVSTVQAIPQVKQSIEQLNQRPNDAKALIEHFEKIHGKKKIDMVLQKLNIKRPT